MSAADPHIDTLRTLAASDALPLPSLPEIALRINNAISDESKHVAHVSSLVQMDAALAARVLKVANSVLYHNGSTVEDCHQAIVRLGLDTTRHLVCCLVMHNVFELETVVLRARVRSLWQHSCRVAAIAHVLAGISAGLRAEKAMLAGLLHDIGTLSILVYAQQQQALLEEPARLERIIATLRGELGAAVLARWGLGADIGEAAREAETWSRAVPGPIDYADVIIVAQLHSYLGSDSAPDDAPPLTQVPAFNKFAISRMGPAAALEMLAQADGEIRSVVQMLNA